MRLTIIASLLALAAAASTALAADYNGTVSASNPSFSWDGGPGTSLGVNVPPAGGVSVGNFAGCFEGIADCEETLIKVEAAGKLTVTTDSADDANDTVDLYLWESNAEGTYDDSGDDLGEGTGAGTTGDEKLEVQVNPGYYVAQVKFFLADGDTYKGTATLSGFAPPATAATPAPAPTTANPGPAPAPQSSPAPQSTPAPASKPAPKKASKRKACQKKAKKIRNAKKRKKALKKCKKIKR